MKHQGKTNPPGRIRIMDSFAELMAQKDFQSITTAEIARNASVTEGLIYKYFKDKKALLYQVLGDHFAVVQNKIEDRISRESGSIEKLHKIISTSLECYGENRILARMLMLEVRNSPAFFDSGAYGLVRRYAATILEVIEQGIAGGEIQAGTDPQLVRKVILGAIEHACLGEIIFGRELEIETTASGISDIVFNGVRS
ncbi:MAG: TetR/AcrR family transcriptional regulator [Desulfobacter sp.]|nr:MAG: TetR/AcrR family transcriptional regulator [Desulfobacter sp.]